MYILCFQYRLCIPEELDESREEDELTPEKSSEDDESTSDNEIRRKERIAENNQKFQEHFAAITSAKTTKKVFSRLLKKN